MVGVGALVMTVASMLLSVSVAPLCALSVLVPPNQMNGVVPPVKATRLMAKVKGLALTLYGNSMSESWAKLLLEWKALSGMMNLYQPFPKLCAVA